MQIYDAAVIGGGLAGLSAAITLAQQGGRILLLEARTYPYHRVCGEFLSPACYHYLHRLGVLAAITALKPASISQARVTAGQGDTWNTTLPGAGIGISRYALDALLADQARAQGVYLQEKTGVTVVEGDLQAGFRLRARCAGQEQMFQARAVIAAHGKRSRLDHTLGRPFTSRQYPFMGIKSHFEGPSLSRRVELHTFNGGYCGLSEVENGLTNVCLLVRQDVFQDAGSIDAFVTWMRRQNPFLDHWFTRAQPVRPEWQTVSQLAFCRKSVVEADMLMTGDAAGLIAPLAGDGMEMALQSGQMAAEAVHHFLDGKWTGQMLTQRYSAAWRQNFAARLRLAQWLQSVILRPALVGPGLRLLNHLPALGEFIVSHTRDTRLTVTSGE